MVCIVKELCKITEKLKELIEINGRNGYDLRLIKAYNLLIDYIHFRTGEGRIK